jgi:hypothetical protein
MHPDGLSESNPSNDPVAERAMRFGYLLSQIELGARSIRLGGVDDIPLALYQMAEQLSEAGAIMREISREALDKVVK